MKYSVLGASGFIGSNLVSYLQRQGHHVQVFPRAAAVGTDLGRCISCIGLTADFRERPIEAIKAHVNVTTELLEHNSFESFIYLSSTRVYGLASNTKEDAIISVRSQSLSDLYNISKLMGESACLHSGRSRIHVVRLSNVVGNDINSSNFLPSLIREAVETGSILLHSSLSSSKDYIHIHDVVQVLTQISNHGSQDLYNLASGQNISHEEIASTIKRIVGCDVKVIPNAPTLSFPSIDINRISNEFAFRAQNIRQFFEESVIHYQQQYQNRAAYH